jgi:anti-anti-sigma factor
MELYTYPNGEGYVVEVTGALRASDPLRQLPAAVDRVLTEQSPARVKVRVREVDFVDLEGIATLAQSYKLVRARGARFELIDGQPRVRHRLEQTGLLQLLEGDAETS